MTFFVEYANLIKQWDIKSTWPQIFPFFGKIVANISCYYFRCFHFTSADRTTTKKFISNTFVGVGVLHFKKTAFMENPHFPNIGFSISISFKSNNKVNR